MGTKRKYYAVARGRKPGIYDSWYGPGGAEEQVAGFAGALYRGFTSPIEAKAWFKNPEYAKKPPGQKAAAGPAESPLPPGTIAAYADGGCRGNPGRGGYGAVILDGSNRNELSRGFRLTTNNRMELMACIAVLETFSPPANVVLHSDSSYVVNGMTKGWARKWRANHWMRTKTEPAVNVDLWTRLLDLCSLHRVSFVWVRGHAGNPENERCDELATTAADGEDLREDHGYVHGRTGAAHT